MPPALFTIGHSNHRAEVFAALLAGQGIGRLVDVRSTPFSRYNPQFNRENLKETLEAESIEYIWEGEALGGKQDFEAARQSAAFKEALARLAAYAETAPTAIMCAEEDPARCHRLHLICAAWAPRFGDAIFHIRKGGRVEIHAEVVGGLADKQLDLFG